MQIFNIPLYESLHPAFFAVFVFIGALFGSFFNVLSQRWGDHQIYINDTQSSMWMTLRGQMAKGKNKAIEPKSLMGGRSSCPSCGEPIALYFNIPVLSWIMLAGRSRCCKNRIPLRYLSFELVGAIVFAVIGYLVEPTMYALVLGIAIMVGILIAAIDAQDGFVPDGLLVALIAMTMALSTYPGHWVSSTESVTWMVYVGLFVFSLFGLMSKLAGRGVMGGADQYLLIISAGLQGAVFLKTLPVILIGLILTLWMIRSGLIKRGLFTKLIDSEKAVPAGPAIVLSMLSGVLINLNPNFHFLWF